MYGLINRIKRLLDEIESLLYQEAGLIKMLKIRKGKIEFPCNITEITDGYSDFNNGSIWSEKEFSNYALFRFDIEIQDVSGDEDVFLHISTNQGGGHNMVRPQMLLIAADGVIQGLDTNHEYVRLDDSAKGIRRYYVYAFSGIKQKTPYGKDVDLDVADGVRLYVDVQKRNRLLNDFYFNVKTAYTYLHHFDEGSFEYQKILHIVSRSLTYLDLRNPYTQEFNESVTAANKYIQRELYDKNYSGTGNATLVGHTHIDLAWLWQYEHTKDKAVRSFATEVKLLDEYPEHRFMSGQAQLYEYVKNQTPALFAKIKALIEQGRWEAEGAMWVEPDMNLCFGESIIRQILYGKKFFIKEFGVDCKVLWLPDVFGYSASLPQILKKSGIKYFMTAKLGTNEKNRFPFDTFYWKGIDGSRVLSHLTSYLPGVYNPDIHSGEILTGWRNYAQKDINDDILIPFGYADGGGGPTYEQIEEIKRLKNGLPGVPRVKIGKVLEYFETLEEKLEGQTNVPIWNGEIYYEKHRGTYTSMAKNKLKNRKCEILFQNAEWLWSLANVFHRIEFPKDEFESGMKRMLLNQFHDVLPGTSIKEVYDDSDALYHEAFDIGEKICRHAIDTIVSDIQDEGVVVFNPYSEKTDGYVSIGGELYFVKDVPAKGFSVYKDLVSLPQNPVIIKHNQMENQYYVLTLSSEGFIESLYDKSAQRQCFISGCQANRLRIFEDKPGLLNGWKEDNWNLDSYYRIREFSMPRPNKIEIIENGAERGIIRIERKYQNSLIKQDVIMYARSPRIDFRTEIDWHENGQVLKSEFPVDVNATRASYEIQFGYIERPTTSNTSWEEAKFEVCGHRWADISDGGYGMALMNDCKYGYSAEESRISLTLLRCGDSPNPYADKEKHSFTYSILPHKGSLQQAGVIKHAFLLNNPLFAVEKDFHKGGLIPDSFSLFTCHGAVLDTIKPAEDGDGYILRVYESNNTHSDVTILCGSLVTRAFFVDLMENELGSEPSFMQQTITFPIKPFEIVTIKLWLDI